MSKLFAALVLAALAFPWSAQAHDHWIAQGLYRSPTDGTLCCNQLDCSVVPREDVKITAAGYVVESIGDLIPFSEAIPSEDGDYHRCKRGDGSRRCFFAPLPGS